MDNPTTPNVAAPVVPTTPVTDMPGVGLDGRPLPPGVMGPKLETGPGKKWYPFQWIYRMNLGGFHFFPYGVMLLLLIGVLPMILFSMGLPLPQITSIPYLHDIFASLGMYSDRDLFVSSTWLIWWPIFIFTILIFRRLWCGGFCPFGLTTDMGNWVGKKLRNGQEAKPLSITRFVFMGFVTFLIIGYLHDALNITNSIIMSVEFVLFFFFFAFIVGVMLPRRSFCRSFCFVGGLPHLFGRLAFLGLKTDRKKCTNCKGQWCVSSTRTPPANVTSLRKPLINSDGCPMYINVPQLGHTESNRHCILCGNCIKNCPYDAIQYKYLPPGYEILKGIQLNWYETMFTIGITAVLAMFVAMEGGLLKNWGEWLTMLFELPTIKFHWLIAGTYVLVAGVVLFGLYFLASALTASMLRLNIKDSLIYFGYIYLPFCYLMFFRDIFVVYFVNGSIIQVWLGTLAVNGHRWALLLVPSIEIFIIFIATAWSLFLAYRVVQIAWVHQNPNGHPEWEEILAGAFPHMLLVLGLAWYWVALLGPEQILPFVTLGISPWVPYAIPLICIIIFFIMHRAKLLKPLEWEMEN
jgi:polyferredoxin